MMSWLKRWQRPIIIGSVLAIIAGGLWFLYTKGPLGPTKVIVANASKEDLKPAIFGIGTVEARLSYTVGPTQAGRLVSVLFDQGDYVKKGQAMGKMDPIDLLAKKAAAEAALAKAQQNIASFEAQVRETESKNILAMKTAERYRELFASQAVSAEVLENKENEAIAATASYDAAKSSLSAAKEDIVKAAAEKDVIEQQIDNLKLLSPVDALVISRDVEPGATVVAGQAVFQLVDPATLWVKTRIDQSRFYGISVGQQAEIVLRSRQDNPLEGTVARMEVQGDSVTEERFVNVTFNNLTGIIPLGELAEVTIELPAVSKALTVPTAAVKRINKQNGVWFVKNNKIKFTPVKIGVQTLEGKTQIIDGLKDGDMVVIYSPKLLADDMNVRAEKRL